ncbi:MAG: DUF962 domain-containing protein [Pirellulales bacterium]|nr:DUF962 domain-containing protein [Pirellulales bacterium]
MSSHDRFQSFTEFWPYYVGEHSHSGCRWLHFIGTTLVIGLVGYIIYAQNWWLLLLAPVVGYGFAWVGHFGLEKNRPATFTYPLWSLIGDFKMWGLMVTGQMNAEIARIHTLAQSR